jgi:Putative MetA-pathway of phenol degradation
MPRLLALFALLAQGVVVNAWAQDSGTPLAKGIQDNSFLIEEAYNQEAGVVQHINTLQRRGGDWEYRFTQEWPLGSQTHQFSYSIPHLWLSGQGSGTGDVMLNYRYQVWKETDSLPAFAPRLSLVVPSGDRSRGTGQESFGYEVNLPFSKIVSDRVTLHANAGFASFADVEGRTPTSYRVGGSAIYAITRETNVLLEALAAWEESVNAVRDIEREFVVTASPGVRHAFNFPDAQLVIGAAAPISFTGEKVDYGIFLYLSFEHKFLH